MEDDYRRKIWKNLFWWRIELIENPSWACLVGAVSKENLFNSTTLYWALLHKPRKKSAEINWWSSKKKKKGHEILAFGTKIYHSEMISGVCIWFYRHFYYTRNMFMIEKWENAGKEFLIDINHHWRWLISIYLYVQIHR